MRCIGLPGALLVCATLFAGCFSITDYDNLQDSREETFTLPYVQTLAGFDILFVVDNSGSTDFMLESIGGMAPGMLQGIDDATDGALSTSPSLQIGVITPDMGAGNYGYSGCYGSGDGGVLQTVTANGCPTLDGSYIIVQNGIVQNMGEITNVEDAVQCLVDGQRERPTGCGFEQPLAALAKALDVQQTPENAGFLRENAGLAVVLMTDEDDCSAAEPLFFDPTNPDLGPVSSFRCFEWGVTCDQEPRIPGEKTNCRPRAQAEGALLVEPTTIADRILSIKDSSSLVFAAVLQPVDQVLVEMDQNDMPYVQAECGESGMPGIRLRSFISRFGEFGLEDSICEPQISGLLSSISERMAAQAVSRCMPKRPADRDEVADGLQPECTAWDVMNLGQVNEERSPDILACSDTGDVPPCWRILGDEMCTSGYKMEVLRAEDPPLGSIVEATCWVMLE